MIYMWFPVHCSNPAEWYGQDVFQYKCFQGETD